jgi:hypothetical protein
MRYKVLIEAKIKPGHFEEFSVLSHYVEGNLLHLVTGRLACGVADETVINTLEVIGYFTQDID